MVIEGRDLADPRWSPCGGSRRTPPALVRLLSPRFSAPCVSGSLSADAAGVPRLPQCPAWTTWVARQVSVAPSGQPVLGIDRGKPVSGQLVAGRAGGPTIPTRWPFRAVTHDRPIGEDWSSAISRTSARGIFKSTCPPSRRYPFFTKEGSSTCSSKHLAHSSWS
jgi:hypothetical protein